MPVGSLINRSATLLRREPSGETDEFGNPIETVSETEILCELQQRQRDEEDDQGEFSESLWNLFLPAGTALDTGDAIVVDGAKYELVGEPWETRNPRSQQFSHVQATVRRTGGG